MLVLLNSAQNYASTIYQSLGMTQGAENVQNRTNFRFWVWSFGSASFFAGNLVPQSFWERQPIVVQWKP